MQVGTMAMSYAFFLDFNVFVYVQWCYNKNKMNVASVGILVWY